MGKRSIWAVKKWVDLAVIDVRDISFSFDFNGPEELQVLRNISFEVVLGNILCIMGPSGSGKTTLLRVLGKELRQNTGTVRIDPDNRKSELYLAPEHPALLDFRTVLENVLLARELVGRVGSELAIEARDLLTDMGLKEDSSKRPHELSEGMRQRVALAQSLLRGASILLLDEPFSGLDILTRRQIEEVVFGFSPNMTKLIVTHDLETALSIADQIFILSGPPWHRSQLVDVQEIFGKERLKPNLRRNTKEFAVAISNLQKALVALTGE